MDGDLSEPILLCSQSPSCSFAAHNVDSSLCYTRSSDFYARSRISKTRIRKTTADPRGDRITEQLREDIFTEQPQHSGLQLTDLLPEVYGTSDIPGSRRGLWRTSETGTRWEAGRSGPVSATDAAALRCVS